VGWKSTEEKEKEKEMLPAWMPEYQWSSSA
jgi:hypothetical protein